MVTHDSLLNRLKILYPYLPGLEQIRDLHRHGPASNQLYQRLSKGDVELLIQSYPQERAYLLAIPTEKEMALVNYAVSISHELATKIGLPQAVPPDNIHRMQKSDIYWRGDIYSANMILAALELSRESMNKEKVFLDFGCSSGSLIRVIKAVYPDSICIGVDPVDSSIQWAREHLSGITFDVSPIAPPLNCATGSVDVVSAISIWSHFSPTAAIDWMNETHRILVHGGCLVFTLHSIYSLLWSCKNRTRKPDNIERMYRAMCHQGFYFEAMQIEEGLPLNPDWGNLYMTIEWLMDRIQDRWDVLLYQPGRNQHNQDLLVLKSK